MHGDRHATASRSDFTARAFAAALAAAFVLSTAATVAADPASRCAIVKLAAASAKLSAKARCHATAMRRALAVDSACLAKAEQKFAAAFAKVEARGGCVTLGDAAAVEDIVDTALANLLDALPNTTTTTSRTTTSTTTTTTTSSSSSSSSSTSTSTSTSTSSTAPVAVCGDGVRDPGEQCDGGALCSAGCTLVNIAPGCCEFPEGVSPGCHDASGFSLNFNMYSYCLTLGAPNVPGGVCGAAGNCDILPIDPVPLCCEQQNGACSHSGSAANTAALWSFFNYCEGASFRTSHTVAGATCGVAGVCEAS